ncbi:MAG: right-handed parallel beta-helix repeat-containing protein [Phycisphaerales bacterium]
MARALLVIVVVGLLAAAPGFAQTVLYVNGEQTTGANTGASWADAFRGAGALQRGLEVAGAPGAGAPVVEVWVARGTYVPSARTDAGQALSVTFRLRSRVQLYGGFVGTERARPERNPRRNPTVLSGVLGPGPAERAWHVVTTGGTDETCVLDGLVVRDGYATDNGSGGGAGQGAGIYNVGGSPVVRDCSIVNNRIGFPPQGQTPLGGGVYTLGGSPRFVGCEFRGNGGGCEGGGLWGDATLIGCSFVGNTAGGQYGAGGAVNGNCFISGCVFRNNFGKFGAGAVQGTGTIEDCVFEANHAGHGGAALSGSFTVMRSVFKNNEGWVSPQVSGTLFVECSFISNRGDYSAPVRGDTFLRCRFDGNVGTPAYGVSITTRAENCLFTRNGTVSVGGGGAVTSCTFIENMAPQLSTGVSAASTVTNCILWGSGSPPSQSGQIGGSFVVRYSCIQGWDGSLGGVANFGADPMLDAEGRPLPLSPCIDAGDGTALAAGAATDILGQPRRVDDAGMPNTGVGVPPVDIGAVEFQGTSCYANCDGSVAAPVLNVGDLGCFVQRFAQGSPYANCDGSSAPPVLNIADFACFLQRFQEGCP